MSKVNASIKTTPYIEFQHVSTYSSLKHTHPNENQYKLPLIAFATYGIQMTFPSFNALESYSS